MKYWPQVWAGVGAVLTADTTLTAQLAGGAGGIFYAEDDAKAALSYPAVRISTVGVVGRGVTSIGAVAARMQIDVFGTVSQANHAIAGRIEELLAIPIKRPGGIVTANLRVTEMWRHNTVPLQTPLTVDGVTVKQLAVDFELRVQQHTA